MITGCDREESLYVQFYSSLPARMRETFSTFTFRFVLIKDLKTKVKY